MQTRFKFTEDIREVSLTLLEFSNKCLIIVGFVKLSYYIFGTDTEEKVEGSSNRR